MKKAVGKALKISGLVLGILVLLAAAAALLAIFDKPLVRRVIRDRLNKTPGTTVRFDRLDYSLFPFRVSVEALEFARQDAFKKMDVSLARLDARGSFWKLVRGVKPALDAIEIDGLSFRLEQKAKSEEPFDLEALLVQATDTLAKARRVSLNNARLSLAMLGFGADLERLDLGLPHAHQLAEALGGVLALEEIGADEPIRGVAVPRIAQEGSQVQARLQASEVE
jgi:hypothetical protein